MTTVTVRFMLLFILLLTPTVATGEPTALHVAAAAGQAAVVTALLEHGADAEAQEKNGVTALHVAAQVGQADVAKRLLEAGADVEARTTDGWTPRDLGKNKHKDIIRLLDQATSS